MTLTHELDLDLVKIKRLDKYLGQRSFTKNLRMNTHTHKHKHTHTHTHRTDYSIQITEVVGNKYGTQSRGGNRRFDGVLYKM